MDRPAVVVVAVAAAVAAVALCASCAGAGAGLGEGEDVGGPGLVLNELPWSEPPGDFIELLNVGDVDVDAGGFTVLDQNAHTATIPAGTVVAAGARLVLR